MVQQGYSNSLLLHYNVLRRCIKFMHRLFCLLAQYILQKNKRGMYMVVSIIYWGVIMLLIIVGSILLYRKYKFNNIKIAWWSYLLYIATFLSWLVVKQHADVRFFITLATTLAVLYVMLAIHQKN